MVQKLKLSNKMDRELKDRNFDLIAVTEESTVTNLFSEGNPLP